MHCLVTVVTSVSSIFRLVRETISGALILVPLLVCLYPSPNLGPQTQIHNCAIRQVVLLC